MSAGATPIDDSTERTDDICRSYAAVSPVALDRSSVHQVVLRADFAAAGQVTISRLAVDLTSWGLKP